MKKDNESGEFNGRKERNRDESEAAI